MFEFRMALYIWAVVLIIALSVFSAGAETRTLISKHERFEDCVDQFRSFPRWMRVVLVLMNDDALYTQVRIRKYQKRYMEYTFQCTGEK
jgi:hypothetical protein